MPLSNILAGHIVQKPSSSSLFVVVFFFQIFCGYSDTFGFFAPHSCIFTFFNHCTLLSYITGRSYILLQNVTFYWLFGLKSLHLSSFSSLSNNLAWFVEKILFWTHCSVFASYLANLSDTTTTLCFGSSIIIMFSHFPLTLYQFSSCFFIVSL